MFSKLPDDREYVSLAQVFRSMDSQNSRHLGEAAGGEDSKRPIVTSKVSTCRELGGWGKNKRATDLKKTPQTLPIPG